MVDVLNCNTKFLFNSLEMQMRLVDIMKSFKEWLQLNEEKDACYHKVKSRYRVWPSAYASGSLVKCRKVGAKNWGNSKNEDEISVCDQSFEELSEGKFDLEKEEGEVVGSHDGACFFTIGERHGFNIDKNKDTASE